MHFKLLSNKDLKAMDALIDSYGGAKEISKKIGELRNQEKNRWRKGIRGDAGKS